MEPDYRPRDAEPSLRPDTFLGSLQSQLNDTKQILYGVTERLNQAGFYPNPQSTGEASKPIEATIRSEITNQIDLLRETALMVKQQVDRIV